jgi:hypothetical protein
MSENLTITTPSFVLKKSQFIPTAKNIADTLLEEVDSVTAFIAAKQLTEIAKVLVETIKPYAEKKVGLKPVVIQGVTVKSKALAKKYDYGEDPELATLNEKLEQIKENIDKRKTLLECMKKSVDVVDKKTGEVVTVKPAKLISAGSTLEVTFEK